MSFAKRGWHVRGILFLLVAAAMAGGLSEGSTFASPLLDRVVAIVNKEVITWSELYRTMEFEVMSGDMRSMSSDDRKKLFKESEAMFLEGMIDKKLQMQAAKRLDIEASKEELAEAIGDIKKKYSMDDKAFEESLKKEGFSLDEYRKRLAEHIVLSKVVGQQVRNKIVVTDEEVKEYMAKNADTEFRVRQIFFKKPEKESEKSSVEARAEDVFQRVKAGEDFAAAAFKYSEDPTGKVGGDLGFIKKDLLGREFLDVLSAMPVGGMSRPFWTASGLHIVKLEEKVDSKNVEEFRDSVKKKLFDRKFDQEYRNWIRGLREKAFVEVRL